MLLSCCLIHIGIIILGRFIYLLYLCPCLRLQWLTGYLGLWFLWGVGYSGRRLVSVFQKFSVSINEASILAGRLGAGLAFNRSLDTFLIFPYFSRS